LAYGTDDTYVDAQRSLHLYQETLMSFVEYDSIFRNLFGVATPFRVPPDGYDIEKPGEDLYVQHSMPRYMHKIDPMTGLPPQVTAGGFFKDELSEVSFAAASTAFTSFPGPDRVMVEWTRAGATLKRELPMASAASAAQFAGWLAQMLAGGSWLKANFEAPEIPSFGLAIGLVVVIRLTGFTLFGDRGRKAINVLGSLLRLGSNTFDVIAPAAGLPNWAALPPAVSGWFRALLRCTMMPLPVPGLVQKDPLQHFTTFPPAFPMDQSGRLTAAQIAAIALPYRTDFNDAGGLLNMFIRLWAQTPNLPPAPVASQVVFDQSLVLVMLRARQLAVTVPSANPLVRNSFSQLHKDIIFDPVSAYSFVCWGVKEALDPMRDYKEAKQTLSTRFDVRVLDYARDVFPWVVSDYILVMIALLRNPGDTHDYLYFKVKFFCDTMFTGVEEDHLKFYVSRVYYRVVTVPAALIARLQPEFELRVGARNNGLHVRYMVSDGAFISLYNAWSSRGSSYNTVFAPRNSIVLTIPELQRLQAIPASIPDAEKVSIRGLSWHVIACALNGALVGAVIAPPVVPLWIERQTFWTAVEHKAGTQGLADAKTYEVDVSTRNNALRFAPASDVKFYYTAMHSIEPRDLVAVRPRVGALAPLVFTGQGLSLSVRTHQTLLDRGGQLPPSTFILLSIPRIRLATEVAQLLNSLRFA